LGENDLFFALFVLVFFLPLRNNELFSFATEREFDRECETGRVVPF
jgi:hypothetical protein